MAFYDLTPHNLLLEVALAAIQRARGKVNIPFTNLYNIKEGEFRSSGYRITFVKKRGRMKREKSGPWFRVYRRHQIQNRSNQQRRIPCLWAQLLFPFLFLGDELSSLLCLLPQRKLAGWDRLWPQPSHCPLGAVLSRLVLMSEEQMKLPWMVRSISHPVYIEWWGLITSEHMHPSSLLEVWKFRYGHKKITTHWDWTMTLLGSIYWPPNLHEDENAPYTEGKRGWKCI